MKWRKTLASVFYHSGGARLLRLYWGTQSLTVLAYHRIIDVHSPDFKYLASNVSATPAQFRQQIDYIAKHYHVIDLATLRAHIKDGQPLPPRALLITFDDGYLDNYENAVPILQEYKLPAVIFVVTSRMTDPRPLWWDECAAYFHATAMTTVDLPFIGQQTFTTLAEKRRVCDRFAQAIKVLPEAERLQMASNLTGVLNVPPLNGEALFMSWDHVREIVAGGIACQPHTANHPILTRVDHDTMVNELRLAKMQIEQETDQTAYALAYPNGTSADYNADVMTALADLGYEMAFSLLPGPSRMLEIRSAPLEIRRVFLGYWDSFGGFVVKVAGVPRLVAWE